MSKFSNYYPLLILLFISACSEKKPADDHIHPDLTTGNQLFDYHCASCHGTSGKGQFIEGIPANVLTKKSPAMVIKKIKFGDETPNSIMPKFKNMPKEEAILIVRHLFQLKENYYNSK